MTIQEAIEARHSVRAYKDLPLSEEIVKLLEDELVKLNHEGQLHIQLICNEPKAFQGTMAKYGKFRNANNYLVMAGESAMPATSLPHGLRRAWKQLCSLQLP